MRGGTRRGDAHRVVHQACSWFLSYPDEAVWERIPLVTAALVEIAEGRRGAEPARRLLDFVHRWTAAGQRAAQREYIDVFDLSRASTLYLSYWSDGDTRRRGSSLAEFKQLYRDSGMLVDLRGELPDHLPILLEYAARVDPRAGLAELSRHRRAVDRLAVSLRERGSAYAEVLDALRQTLPEAKPGPPLTAPPAEAVGLDPYDPRSLPIVEVS